MGVDVIAMFLYRIINLIKLPFSLVYARLFPVSYARSIGVKLGKGVSIYGSSYSMFSSEPYLVSIGDNVHITHAKFICHDGAVLPYRSLHPTLDITAPISIGSNTFIGYGALILSGASIGRNCIVGARAVVTKNIPEGSVVAGNPCKIIGSTQDYVDRSLERSTGLGAYYGFEKRRKYFEYFDL
jgi:acetyltransferase-like isoleucine patch superfamily enzyme